ncbi:MAG: hypothetical protein V5A13_02095 [Haloarculaceae archaeon]
MATERAQETAERLPERVVADLLASDRRQRLLDCLEDRGGCLAVTDLAAAVAARETGTDLESVDPERHRAVREEIYERHLPKLTATGVVEFDSMRGTVTLSASGIAEEGR